MKLTIGQLIIAILLTGLSYAKDTNGQALLEKTVTITIQNEKLENALKELSKQANIKFSYSREIIETGRHVSVSAKNEKLSSILDVLFKSSGIQYEVISDRIILTKTKENQPGQIAAANVPNMVVSENAFSVTGTVFDETGIGLPGVTVRVTNTTKGTVTDQQGNFKLDGVEATDSLSFSFVGYAEQRAVVGSERVFNIKMAISQNTRLNEVVVIGYGTLRKADLTSSISTVDAKALRDLPVTGIEQALQGRASGVTVTSASGLPGSPVSVRIRGIGTVNNNDPLYVVDGVPVENMNYLNPSDIESLQVLKDASAAAIYGSRAANGVILITTKKGSKGSPVVTFEGYVGSAQPWKNYKPADADEYLYMMKSIHGETGAGYLNAKAEYDQGFNTNWWKETVKSALVQSYNVGINGGTDNARYNLSAAYFDQEGIIKPSGFKRISVRLNTDFKLNKRVKVGENLSISNQVTENTLASILQSIQLYDPLVPVVDPARDQSDPFSKWGNSNITFGSSPKALLARQIGDSRVLRIVGNVYGNVKIVDGLDFNTNFGVDISRNENKSFSPTYYFDPSDQNTVSSVTTGALSRNGWVWSNTLNYTKKLGRHKFTILAGTQAEYNETHGVNGSNYGQPGNDPYFQYLDAGTKDPRVNGTATEWSIASYFGRINYNYDDKYLLAASIRRDGSANFYPGHRWGTFPSVSAGWVVSRENFWQSLNMPWFTNFKVRGGWGQLGNQNIGAGSYTSFVEGTIYRRFVLNDGDIVQGYAISNTGNRALKWETSEQSNLGLEFGFFNDALTLEAEYYNRKTRDMLILYPVAATFGVSSPWVNAGTVSNKGFEFTANYNGSAGKLKYTLGGNLSTYRNKVTSLGEGQPYVESVPGSRVTAASRTAVGHPIGEFYGWKTNGIFQSEQEVNNYVNSSGQKLQPNARPGDFRFVDVDGNGIINDNDKTAIGNPHPKFTYGFNINLKYSSFDLIVFLQGSYGNKLFNNNKYQINHPLGFDNIAAGAAYNAWTPDNKSNTNPIMSVNDPNNNFRASDWYVESGSYTRIKNIQLGYSLSSKALSALKISQMRVYISAQNLFTFTKYSGLDPEIGPYGEGDVGKRQRLIGMDYFTFPQSRTLQVGVNMKF
ncbi:SusC/RagA family TonB-linked outer membrane protein [Mucilaginibacter limnophilus]|nr:SusC/RagA family TonB-linked outer membrane protein [Mucilaginibacter limnophilus]